MSNTTPIRSGPGVVKVLDLGNMVGGPFAASLLGDLGVITLGSGVSFMAMSVSNANVTSTGLLIGSNASYDTVTVLPGTTWNLAGGAVQVGSGSNASTPSSRNH